MSDPRLPAHLEISALVRLAESSGGFATVVAKGERDAGVILILTTDKGENARLWERVPSLDGSRRYSLIREQETDKKDNLTDYIQRRRARDCDLWVVELDIAHAERFVADIAR